MKPPVGLIDSREVTEDMDDVGEGDTCRARRGRPRTGRGERAGGGGGGRLVEAAARFGRPEMTLRSGGMIGSVT